MRHLLFSLLVTLVVSSLALPVEATPPVPPAKLQFEKALDGRLQAEMALPLVVEISRPIKSASITVAMRPVEAIPKQPEVVGRINVDANRGRRPVEIRFKPPRTAGEYEIDIRLRGEVGPGYGFSDRKILYLQIDANGGYRIVTPKQRAGARKREREQRFQEDLLKDPGRPKIRLLLEPTVKVPADIAARVEQSDVSADKRMGVRPAGISDNLRRYVVDHSDRSWAPNDPLTIRGRLLFQDFDNLWKPIVNATVHLWDEDTGWDEHLGTVASGWDGRWSFTVSNNDGWGADGRDIYYSFKTSNTRFRIEDCDGIDSTYEYESSVHDDVSDGTTIDFGDESGGDQGLLRVWNMLNNAWNHASNVGGQDPGFVDTCYPEDSTSWGDFWEEIDIEAQYQDGPDVVTHEYGHAIMYYAYDEEIPGPGGDHMIDACGQNTGMAWSEGWATGFMLSLKPDGAFNWHEGDGGFSIENASFTCTDGNTAESRVSAAINDLLDSANDCNGGSTDRGRDSYCDNNNANRVSLATMLHTTMWGSWNADFIDFWYSLSGELSSGQAAPAQEAMYYNWMPVVAPSSCVASKVATEATPDRESLLAGLRALRDNALKTFPGGRELIQVYYRNSPEMAVILLRDADARQAALRIVQHYGKLGAALERHATHQELIRSREPVVTPEIGRDIAVILASLEKNGSATLRNDVALFRRVLNRSANMTLSEVASKVTSSKDARTPRLKRLHQSDLSPGSQKAAPELRDRYQKVPPPPR